MFRPWEKDYLLTNGPYPIQVKNSTTLPWTLFRPEIHAGYALTLMQDKRSDETLADARIVVSLAPDDIRAN